MRDRSTDHSWHPYVSHSVSHHSWVALLVFLFPLVSATANAKTDYYISPGFKVMYRIKDGFSYGVKISLGREFFNGVANITFGILAGDSPEGYVELQIAQEVSGVELPILPGAGLGFSYIDLGRYSQTVIRPRLTVFAGMGLFLNGTYVFFLPDNMPGLQLGSTAVVPIPLMSSRGGGFGF